MEKLQPVAANGLLGSPRVPARCAALAETLPQVTMPNREGFTPRFPNLMGPRSARDL